MLISGEFTTRSPLSHISETISTGALLNERPMIQHNGELVDVFCYNGNAWRGQLRDLMALHLIDKVGIKNLSVEKHNFLFSGGKIGGASKFNLANIRNHFELMPHFSLLGGCLDNMMLPGKISILDCLPLCQEAIVELPESAHKIAVENTYRHMTIERDFTRMDDSKNMSLNQTLDIDPKKEKEAIQMRMSSELLNSGVDINTQLLLSGENKLEIGALCSALSMFAKKPFIGGQHNKGHGKVDLIYHVNEKHFFSVTGFDVKTSSIFNECLNDYNAHLEQNAEAIKELLA